MMESIRRRFKVSSQDPWTTDLVLEPEGSDVSEVQLDRTVMLTTRANPHTSSNDVDLISFYKSFVLAAIRQGGNHNGQHIAVPWLRMTLAGLEMRPMPPEMMWEGESDGLPAEMPGYQELFPEARPPQTT